MVSFISRSQMYFFERMHRYISVPIVKSLAKTKITPNMVTITNFILAAINSYLLFNNKLSIVSAFLMFMYYFLDVVDGNLARCTGKTSKLGATLDKVGDDLFYNIFLITLGINRVPLYILFIVLFLHNIYGIAATYYIVPNIKKIKDFKRAGLKKYFMDKGIILGMDISLLNVLIIVTILSRQYTAMYVIIMILYIADILYRVIELWVNQYIDRQCK